MGAKWAIESIPFEERAVREWLQVKIDHWRQLREEASVMNGELWKTAALYIDAYQNVHCTLFGGPYGQAEHGG